MRCDGVCLVLVCSVASPWVWLWDLCRCGAPQDFVVGYSGTGVMYRRSGLNTVRLFFIVHSLGRFVVSVFLLEVQRERSFNGWLAGSSRVLRCVRKVQWVGVVFVPRLQEAWRVLCRFQSYDTK